jgi:hypothetical protein
MNHESLAKYDATEIHFFVRGRITGHPYLEVKILSLPIGKTRASHAFGGRLL